MAIKNVEADWLLRLFAQWRNSPLILGLIEIQSDPMQDSIDVAEYILDALEDGLDGDVDFILDIFGGILGVARPPKQADRFTLTKLGEGNDPTNRFGFYDSTNLTGGYLPEYEGFANPDGSLYSNDEYRRLLKQKATSWNRAMTREALFTWLLDFDAECSIDGDTSHEVTADPYDFDTINQFEKWYIEQRGFDAAGVLVQIRDRMRDKVYV